MSTRVTEYHQLSKCYIKTKFTRNIDMVEGGRTPLLQVPGFYITYLDP